MITSALQAKVRASDLLATQTKKFTMDMPSGLHLKLKQIAVNNGMTVKELMIEALVEYVIPKYEKEVR